jgi:hypothetical protein
MGWVNEDAWMSVENNAQINSYSNAGEDRLNHFLITVTSVLTWFVKPSKGTARRVQAFNLFTSRSVSDEVKNFLSVFYVEPRLRCQVYSKLNACSDDRERTRH